MLKQYTKLKQLVLVMAHDIGAINRDNPLENSFTILETFLKEYNNFDFINKVEQFLKTLNEEEFDIFGCGEESERLQINNKFSEPEKLDDFIYTLWERL